MKYYLTTLLSVSILILSLHVNCRTEAFFYDYSEKIEIEEKNTLDFDFPKFENQNIFIFSKIIIPFFNNNFSPLLVTFLPYFLNRKFTYIFGRAPPYKN